MRQGEGDKRRKGNRLHGRDCSSDRAAAQAVKVHKNVTQENASARAREERRCRHCGSGRVRPGGALGGGVSRSLSLDNYGKALSVVILGFAIEVPERCANLLRGT